MKYLLLFSSFLFLLSCKNDSRKGDANSKTGISEENQKPLKTDNSANFQEYSNATFHFGLRFPENYKIAGGQLTQNAPVITVFSSQLSQKPPFGIHEDHALGYISVLPKGIGVDGPAGKKMSFKEWNKYLPLSFNIDREKSMVYLLENGQPWGFGLYFYTPPKNWQDFGMIFVRFKVNNFEAKCFNSKGEPKPMQNCDPMGIDADTIKYFGKVDTESKKALHKILRSFYFFDKNAERKPINELIQVENPLPGTKITSPFTLKGKARGYWFFEASAPFKLIDSNYSLLSTGYISATENWMTEDWVPFEKEVTFLAPETAQGYLILKKANASGKPEMDRNFIIPVNF